MSAPESTDSGVSPSLFNSLRSFWAVLLAILHARLDLVTLELEEEASRAVQLIVVSLAAMLCLAMTVFFFLCFLVLLSGPYLIVVLGIICILTLLTSITLILVARRMVLTRPKFLSQTLAELRKDMDGLRLEIKETKAPETRP